MGVEKKLEKFENQPLAQHTNFRFRKAETEANFVQIMRSMKTRSTPVRTQSFSWLSILFLFSEHN